MNKNRLEAFSDGVFAIVITLLVLDIRIPEEFNHSVLQEVLNLLPNILSFVCSFIIIGIYWIAHHSMLEYVSKVDRVTLWLNLFLLLTISFIPFPTSIIAQHPTDIAAIWLYSLNLIMANIAGSIFWWVSTKKENTQIKKLSNKLRYRILLIHSIPAVIYLIGAISASINVYITYALFVVVILFFIVPNPLLKKQLTK